MSLLFKVITVPHCYDAISGIIHGNREDIKARTLPNDLNFFAIVSQLAKKLAIMMQ